MTPRNESAGMLSAAALSARSRAKLEIATLAHTRASTTEISFNDSAGTAMLLPNIASTCAAEQHNLQQEMPPTKCENNFSLLLRN